MAAGGNGTSEVDPSRPVSRMRAGGGSDELGEALEKVAQARPHLRIGEGAVGGEDRLCPRHQQPAFRPEPGAEGAKYRQPGVLAEDGAEAAGRSAHQADRL